MINSIINQSINQSSFIKKQYHFNNIALPVGRIKIHKTTLIVLKKKINNNSIITNNTV